MIKSISDFLENFIDYEYIIALDVLERSFALTNEKIIFVSYEWLSNKIVVAKHDELVQLKTLLEKQLKLDWHEAITINLINDVIKLINSRIGE